LVFLSQFPLFADTMTKGLVAMVLLTLPTTLRGIDPAHAVNITVYHVNPLRYGPKPINMDTGDEAGDMFFDFHNVLIMPLQCPNGAASGHGCANPEALAPDLMVNKVILEVDSRYSGYARCNIGINGSASGVPCADDTYCCACQGEGRKVVPCNTTLGLENIHATHSLECSSHSDPWECYRSNAGKKFTTESPGVWYSSLMDGYCGDTTNYYADNCTWRVVSVPKIITKKCHNEIFLGAVEAGGQDCFSACGEDVKNNSSPCWADCFYKTVLGPNSGKAGGAIAGMSLDSLLAAWKAPFESDDPSKGGCPPTSPQRQSLDQVIV